jgi:hypothetical protein
MSHAPRSAAAPRPEAFEWSHFVARSGAEGSDWVREYGRPDIAALVTAADESLLLLRTRRFAAGRDRLAVMADGLTDGGNAIDPSIASVLERWYYGALAYAQYCVDDFASAEESLGRAHAAVAAAIGRAPFLMPLANHCQEFRLHAARIARNRRRWAEMHEHVAAALGMMEDREPLCVLGDGTEVRFAELVRFYLALPGLSPEEHESLAGQVDPGVRLRLFHRFVQGLYAIPGFVIPYS